MPKKKISSSKKSQQKTQQPIVYIMGESPLVEEYGTLCASKGYTVFVQWNEQGTKTTVNKTLKRTSIIPAKTSLALELTNTDLVAKKKNIQKIDKALPAEAAIISTSITVTATEQATWIRHRHRLVGFGALPGFSAKPLVEVAPTVFSPKETIEVVQKFFTSIGKEIELVQDRIGMVLPRILCQIINEATFALMEDVASPKDIDTAMKLGLNYPYGPIEWADKIGIRQIYAVLSALEADLNEDRYRISPLLRQMALGSEWWKSK